MEDKENIENQEQMASMFDDNNIDDGLDGFDFGENLNNDKAEIEAEVEAENEISEETNAIEADIEAENEIEKNVSELEEDIATDDFSENEIVEEKTEEIQVEEVQAPAKKQNFVSTADDFEQDLPQNEELITVRPIKFQDFEDTQPNRAIKKNLDILQDISMHISVELGRTKSTIRDVMELEKGSVVELDKIAGEQVEVFVNEKLIAKGEVIVIEDKFGVRVTSTNIAKNTQ